MNAVLVKQTIKKYKESEVVFSEGDAGNEMYIINSGRILITKKNNGGQVILEELKPKVFSGKWLFLQTGQELLPLLQWKSPL